MVLLLLQWRQFEICIVSTSVMFLSVSRQHWWNHYPAIKNWSAPTAEFIIIDPLHGRRGINGLSRTGAAVVLLSATYTTMLAHYNRVNVYDPRYREYVN